MGNNSTEEKQLADLAKRMLSMPPKPRDESMIGKRTKKREPGKPSPRRSRKGVNNRGNAK